MESYRQNRTLLALRYAEGEAPSTIRQFCSPDHRSLIFLIIFPEIQLIKRCILCGNGDFQLIAILYNPGISDFKHCEHRAVVLYYADSCSGHGRCRRDHRTDRIGSHRCSGTVCDPAAIASCHRLAHSKSIRSGLCTVSVTVYPVGSIVLLPLIGQGHARFSCCLNRKCYRLSCLNGYILGLSRNIDHRRLLEIGKLRKLKRQRTCHTPGSLGSTSRDKVDFSSCHGNRYRKGKLLKLVAHGRILCPKNDRLLRFIIPVSDINCIIGEFSTAGRLHPNTYLQTVSLYRNP